jgi:ubiquitin-protein ligase
LFFSRRLRRECLDLQQNPIPSTWYDIKLTFSFFFWKEIFSAGPTADSLKQWLVVFEGESGSLYEGGTFFALLTFDDDYPFTPPTVKSSFISYFSLSNYSILAGI